MKINKQINYKTELLNGQIIEANSEKELDMLYKKHTVPLKQNNFLVNFPLILSASDYHYFTEYKFVLEKLTNAEINFEEIDCEGGYHAIFWIGIAKPVKLIEKAKKEFIKGLNYD